MAINPLTIALIGDVSSGKSSFLNSLGIGFISSVSLQRETSQPLWYRFSKEHNVDVRSFADMVDQIHIENEKNRLISGDPIKNYDIRNICDAEHTLPIRYDLENYNVIDFPGLNENVLDTLQSLIKQINLIIFVIDSNRAFMNQTEVEYFKSIQKMIHNEELKGRYPEIIILVNKYDDLNDEDLGQIYDKIKSVIEFPNEKIFRLSSHKLLLHAASFYQIDLHIPEYLKKSEIAKIYRNACLSVPVITDNLIPYWENKLDNTQTVGKLNGDWDDLIGYLRNFPMYYHSKLIEKIGFQYYQWELRSFAVYNTLCVTRIYNQFIEFKIDEKELYWDLHKIYKKFQLYGLDMEIFYTKILITVEMIFINHLSKHPIRFVLLENIIADQMIPFKNFSHLIIKYAKMINCYTFKILYLQYFINGEVEIDKEEYLQLSKIIFGKKVMYDTESSTAISFVDQIKESLKIIVKEKKSHYHHIILYWLTIATINKATSIELNKEKMIKFDVLKRIDPTLPVKFRYWLTMPGNDPLYHKLFHIDEIEPVAKYYQTYSTLEELNEMV